MHVCSRTRLTRAVLAGAAVATLAHATPPIDGLSDGVETDPARLANLPHSDFAGPGCVINEPAPPAGARGVIPANVITMVDNGPTSNRVDLVFVGDGYQAGELGLYAVHCQNGLDDLFAITPFSEYRNFFNAHRVEVVSTDSGVDHDPTQGIFKNTALNMGFWCNGIERLLCVGTFQASQYADNAPDVDQIFAVANSTKYGGAGYSSANVGTYAGGNGLAPQIAIHELGHSLGDLADEYDYGGPVTWPGGETNEVDASIFDSAQMASMQTKWWYWLGAPDEGGVCGTFEGCHYSQLGIYRPSNNSMMRALGRPFNNVSIEKIIIEIYKQVDPIDSASPPGFYNSASVIELNTVNPVGHPLSIQWYADGLPVAGANGNTFTPGQYALGAGAHALSVSVIDETDMVRDETARMAYMTDFRDGWTVTALLGDLNGDCVVDTADLGGLVGSFGSTGHYGDINGDGIVDTADLGLLLANFGQSCD
ncbi:MAG: hypothetical protein H6814_05710 [Phycisphaeraceae bacterium]|nr:hypothetical protein [Phycisphaeraceae bacterium]